MYSANNEAEKKAGEIVKKMSENRETEEKEAGRLLGTAARMDRTTYDKWKDKCKFTGRKPADRMIELMSKDLAGTIDEVEAGVKKRREEADELEIAYDKLKKVYSEKIKTIGMGQEEKLMYTQQIREQQEQLRGMQEYIEQLQIQMQQLTQQPRPQLQPQQPQVIPQEHQEYPYAQQEINPKKKPKNIRELIAKYAPKNQEE